LFIGGVIKHTDFIDLEDEMDVSALNLGMIAAYYNISCLFLSPLFFSKFDLCI